jgi:hypothetical protein
MTGVLTEVGKRIATRWITEVLLPGALLAAVLWCAVVLGHRHALDLDALVAAAERRVAGLRPIGWVVRGALAAAAAGVLGVTARGTGRLVQRFWLRERHLLPRWSGRWSRRRREEERARRAGVEPVRAYLPRRPTWMADRLRLVEARVRAEYRVSAALVWPRIWLLTTEEFHASIRHSRARFDEACVLAGWAVLYAVPAAFWWPAAVVGVVTGLVAWRRARASLDEFAGLVESAVDLHLRPLAEALGLPITGDTITATEAARLDDRLRKG